MQEINSFLKNNKDKEFKPIEIMLESMLESSDEKTCIKGIEIQGENDTSIVNIYKCFFESNNASSSNLDNGSYYLEDIVEEYYEYEGVVMCRYYNGYNASDGVKVGMLSFEGDHVSFFRQADDEDANGWVVIIGGSGTLYKS